MHLGKVSLLQRVALSLTQKQVYPFIAIGSSQIVKDRCSIASLRFRHVVPRPLDEIQVKDTLPNIGFLQTLLLKMGLKEARLVTIGHLTYEFTVDRIINYDAFYKTLNMPDTMYSWFLVSELYLWMVMVRYMAEGKDGVTMRNALTKAMWDDVKIRTDKLGYIPSRIKNGQLRELNAQFNAAMVAYDEGMMSDDKVLANALWRRMLIFKPDDAEALEKLVIFVRRQLQLLDSIPRKELVTKPQLQWLDFRMIQPY